MKSFKERLKEASYGEAYVASLLTQAGFTVKLYPTNFDRKKQSAGHYATRSDLSVYRTEKCRGTGIPVEVKNLREWTGFVCSESSFLNRSKLGKVTPLGLLPRGYNLDVDFLLYIRKEDHVVWVPKGTSVNAIPTEDPWGGSPFSGIYSPSYRSFDEFVAKYMGF